jgi:hypothetical protein
MPIHDWTRVTAGTWHAFHLGWIAEIQSTLNSGLLPPDYYAQAEQIVGPFGPDVLTLQTSNGSTPESLATASQGGLSLTTSPPRTRFIAETDMSGYVLKHRQLVIRHASGDRVVALVELVSPGNKSSRHQIRAFVEKAVEALARGFHLLIVDLFPPGPRDPQGLHALIWEEISSMAFELPPGELLCLSAYAAGTLIRAFVEPTAVGHSIPEMPLFLEAEAYVNVPLESTYQAAFRGVPRRWRVVLEPAS